MQCVKTTLTAETIVETAGVAAVEEDVGVEEPTIRALEKDPNTPIYHQGSGKGAPCTENTGKEHTFVQNRRHVLGRTFLLQDQQNETGTSPANSFHRFKTLCIITIRHSCQK